MVAAAETAGPISAGNGYGDELDRLSFPMVVVDLQQMQVLALTPSAVALGEFPVADIAGRPVLDVIVPEGRGLVEQAFGALANDSVDFFRARIPVVAQPEGRWLTDWAAAADLDGKRVALVQLAEGISPRESPLGRYLGREPVELSFGALDSNWVITCVSSGVEHLLGAAAEEVVGRPLLGVVEQRDVERVLKATVAASADVSVGLSLRVRTPEGGTGSVRAVLHPLAAPDEHFFILVPEPRGLDLRERKLMQHLHRIASEVQASGILEVVPTVPGLERLADRGGLTPRQWEVLTRLLRGERVATIAKELFVSESTVRNHLSVIYKRMGVRSQAELMALAVGESPLSS